MLCGESGTGQTSYERVLDSDESGGWRPELVVEYDDPRLTLMLLPMPTAASTHTPLPTSTAKIDPLPSATLPVDPMHEWYLPLVKR